MDDDRLQAGLRTMHTLFGAEFRVDPRPGEPENAGDLNRLLVEHSFTDCWARPALDARVKSLVTIAFLIAMSQPEELRRHLSGALVLGIPKEELVELMIHALAYCGAPRTASAWAQARSLFAQQHASSSHVS